MRRTGPVFMVFTAKPIGIFMRLARRTEHILGELLTFTMALVCVVIWLVMGSKRLS